MHPEFFHLYKREIFQEIVMLGHHPKGENHPERHKDPWTRENLKEFFNLEKLGHKFIHNAGKVAIPLAMLIMYLGIVGTVFFETSHWRSC